MDQYGPITMDWSESWLVVLARIPVVSTSTLIGVCGVSCTPAFPILVALAISPRTGDQYWNGIGHFRRLFDIPMAITGLGNYRLRCFLQQTRSMVVQLCLDFDVVFHTEWTLTEVLIPNDMCPTVSPGTYRLASL